MMRIGNIDKPWELPSDQELAKQAAKEQLLEKQPKPPALAVDAWREFISPEPKLQATLLYLPAIFLSIAADLGNGGQLFNVASEIVTKLGVSDKWLHDNSAGILWAFLIICGVNFSGEAIISPLKAAHKRAKKRRAARQGIDQFLDAEYHQ
jgi:hypothetical protein